MASGHWTNGAADRDIGTAGNWSGGATPGANEIMYFIPDAGNTASTYPNTGMADLTAIDLNFLHILEGYNQPIGGTTNHLTITSDYILHQGGGTLWWKDGSAAAVSDTLVCDVGRSIGVNPNSVNVQIGNAATITDVNVVRGKTVIESGCTATNCNVGMNRRGLIESYLTIDAGATISSLVEVMRGTLTSDSALATLKCFEGAIVTHGTALITTLWVFPGARIKLTLTGTVATNVHHIGGVIDCVSAGGAKTITNYFKRYTNDDEQNVLMGDGTLVTVTNRL